MVDRFTALFPLWAIALSILAYQQADLFVDLRPAIIPLLMLIMFAMGMTLRLEDFLRVLKQPGIILLGVSIQYLIMPLAAWLIGKLLAVPTEILIGMVLVGSSAGGTASNVICYLAKGDVALSISMTVCSTLLAIVLMPLLTWLYIGQTVPVPVMSMLISILKIVVLPVLLGLVLNGLWHRPLSRYQSLFPLLSSLAIILIIAIIVALNHGKLGHVGSTIIIAVMLHNLFGLAGGYQIGRMLGYPGVVCRTLAIEVGMQNSGLSVALALKYFSAAAALPGALFSIWHNISGAILASFWARQSAKSESKIT